MPAGAEERGRLGLRVAAKASSYGVTCADPCSADGAGDDARPGDVTVRSAGWSGPQSHAAKPPSAPLGDDEQASTRVRPRGQDALHARACRRPPGCRAGRRASSPARATPPSTSNRRDLARAYQFAAVQDASSPRSSVIARDELGTVAPSACRRTSSLQRVGAAGAETEQAVRPDTHQRARRSRTRCPVPTKRSWSPITEERPRRRRGGPPPVVSTVMASVSRATARC